MKVTIEMDINDCRDCPFKDTYREQGFSIHFCSNPQNKRKGFDDYICTVGNFIKTPEWCPFGLNKL